MSDKKLQEKGDNGVSNFYNPVCQGTFQSLPKIYGAIKNKVISNKINFYQNIKRKNKRHVIKSFNKDEIVEEYAKHLPSKSKQKTQSPSFIQKKPLIKLEDASNKKLARFEDKYHKFDLRSVQRRSRIATNDDADDNQSKHKIKFNTIRIMPSMSNIQHVNEDTATFDTIQEATYKSVLINNPLIHLYRHGKKRNQKISSALQQQLVEKGSPNTFANRYSTSKNTKQISIKQRIKTQQDSSVQETFDIRRSNLKTEFSRRLYEDKNTNIQLNSNNKFHIPSKEEYKKFIEEYQPSSSMFNLKKMIKQKNFQIVTYQDGVYFGFTELGVKTGEGVLVTQKCIFEGIFQDDFKVKGTEQNADGKYVGHFKNNKRDGKGRFQWNNGQYFEGDWKEGKKNGFGIWQSPNGDSYVGDWVNGRQHGTGTHNHKNSTYKGEFYRSLKHGNGEQTFANGDKFKGNYVNGKPDGKGKYEWIDGSFYEGEFKGGYRDGYGVLKEVDGSIYKGSFRRDFKHGLGQQLHSGEKYEVEYQDGVQISKSLKIS